MDHVAKQGQLLGPPRLFVTFISLVSSFLHNRLRPQTASMATTQVCSLLLLPCNEDANPSACAALPLGVWPLRLAALSAAIFYRLDHFQKRLVLVVQKCVVFVVARHVLMLVAYVPQRVTPVPSSAMPLFASEYCREHPSYCCLFLCPCQKSSGRMCWSVS